MSTHLVTGAAGYLGRYLVSGLVSRDERVRAFDLSGCDQAEPRAEWRLGDVRDAGALRGACQGVEYVYHLAALIPQRKADAETLQAVNVGGTRHLLDAARASGVRRVVYLSSVEIYGIPSVVPCPEDGLLAPLGEYGRSKIAAEALCREEAERGLEVVILRPPTVVGPGLDEPFLVGLLGDIRDGRPVRLIGRGENRFQFVHVEDVVAACLLAAEHPGAVGEAFNVGSTRVPPIRQMVEEVIGRVGSPSVVRTIPTPVVRAVVGVLRLFGKAPLEPEHLAIATADYVFDVSRARRMLGWEPRHGNVDAVVEAYEWLAARAR